MTITDWLSWLIPLTLCLVLIAIPRRPAQDPQEKRESDSWYITCGIQEAYDAIAEEAEEWRKTTESRKPKSRFSFPSRKKPTPFVVNKADPPTHYAVDIAERGEISFELTQVTKDGTLVRLAYDSRARRLIQNFKAKRYLTPLTPIRVPPSAPNVCPSCGKEILPDFNLCPFCGTKLRQE